MFRQKAQWETLDYSDLSRILISIKSCVLKQIIGAQEMELEKGYKNSYKNIIRSSLIENGISN